MILLCSPNDTEIIYLFLLSTIIMQIHTVKQWFAVTHVVQYLNTHVDHLLTS